MQADLSGVTFNPDHRRDSLGLQALNGLRLVLLSWLLSAGWAAAYFLLLLVSVPDPVYDTLAVAMPITAVVAFGAGAYGSWLVIDALGWAKFISFMIIASFLIPFFRLVALLVVGALALDLVFKSSYRVSLFGKPVRRTPVAVAG